MNGAAAFAQTRRALGDASRDARSAWGRRETLWLGAALLALLAPAILPLSGRMPDLASWVYLVLAAVGLSYVAGLAGIPSLGQGAFVGIGAFAEAIARAKVGWPLLPSLALAVLAAVVAGMLTALATGRLRGAFTAAATWILTWIVALGLVSFPGVSGGAQGLVLPQASVLGLELTPTVHYEVGVVLVALAVLAYAVIARRGPGLALAAARDDPGAARALAVPAARLRFAAFTAAAAVAGLAGALGVELVQVADPTSYDALLSFELFVAVILGGARSPLGAVLGMVVLAGVSQAADEIGAALDVPPGRLDMMVTGYVLLVALGLGGEGLIPAVLGSTRRRGARTRGMGAQPLQGPPVRAPDPAGLTARGVSKRFGKLVALDDLDLQAVPGSIHALIGPNGSGKTTALRILVGALPQESGTVALGADRLDGLTLRERALRGVVATQQTTAVFADLTVLENALVGAGLRRRHGGALRTLLATPKARAESRAARGRAVAALALVGLADRLDRPAGELSALERRLLMLASALATEPRVLLLDEPAAGASPAELERVAELLADLRGSGFALLVIEHNLRFVRLVADQITVLSAGQVIASGAVADVAEDEAVRAAYFGRQGL
ncbi:MAG TPA: ATP-binding cassette domain-containing protein [Gaiellaceae bacterium]|nr:ATP-binding cassette domain-containing protein [Gaiellaceae bacterium]